MFCCANKEHMQSHVITSTVERLGVDGAEEITLDTEFLQLSYRKANKCGHFAAIIVPKVFPELFGPIRLRLQYNWEENKGQDEQRENVLKTGQSILPRNKS